MADDELALAEEAYLQAEQEVERLRATVAVLERRLSEEKAQHEQLWRDARLLLGEAGVSRVRQMLVDQPDRDIEAALLRYSRRVWG